MSDPQNTRATGAQRDALGRVISGSLNPGGRPKSNGALRQKCRDLTGELVDRLRKLALAADSDAASVSAIKLLLAYGHGAPETKPIDDDPETEAANTKVTPAAALKALDVAPLTPEPRGPEDSDH